MTHNFNLNPRCRQSDQFLDLVSVVSWETVLHADIDFADPGGVARDILLIEFDPV